MVAVLASGLLAGGSVIVSGSIMLESIVSSATRAAFSDAENRFAMLDSLLYRVESDTRKTGRAALSWFAASYPTLADAGAAGRDKLKADAAALGVDEVYFIGVDGIIGATSFEPDVGFDMFALGSQFTGFLMGLSGSGRYADQRMTMSTATAKANSYQYYGPSGSDYIIEVSTRIDNAVPKTFPRFTFKALLNLLFNAQDGDGEARLVRAIDLIGGGGGRYRSYTMEAFADPQLAALADRALSMGGTAEVRDGSITTIVKPLPLSKFDFDYVDGGTLAVFIADRSMVREFTLISGAVSLAFIAAAIAVSYMLAFSSFRRNVANRLEALSSAMERVGSLGSIESLDDGMEDEISTIARGASGMVDQIRQRNAELSAFARRLEEEVEAGARREKALTEALEANQALVHEMNHRVKNNLQLAMSLASMQARNDCGEETIAALERMRARLGIISMVQDHALCEPERPRVDMQRFMTEIKTDIAAASGKRAASISARIDAGDAEFDPDTAMAVGLIAAELIDNAYSHAFPAGGSGSLEITLRPARDGAAAGGDGGWELVVADDGAGAPTAGGVGLELAGALATQLGGALTWKSDGGTRVAVTMRLA
jgi:two-component sensor histidine kinase